jgi:hypothetical protein
MCNVGVEGREVHFRGFEAGMDLCELEGGLWMVIFSEETERP